MVTATKAKDKIRVSDGTTEVSDALAGPFSITRAEFYQILHQQAYEEYGY
jgi:hypothetical protein